MYFDIVYYYPTY